MQINGRLNRIIDFSSVVIVYVKIARLQAAERTSTTPFSHYSFWIDHKNILKLNFSIFSPHFCSNNFSRLLWYNKFFVYLSKTKN